MENPESRIEGKERLVSGRLIVIKVGGSEGINLSYVCNDVAELYGLHQPFILVHGGSHETSVLAEKLGHPSIFIDLPSGARTRYTDRKTLEIFMMACIKVNKSIVEQLQRLGVNAVGLSGLDGKLLEGKRKEILKGTRISDGKMMVFRDNFAGTVERVNIGLVRLLLDNGYLPVISPPVLSDQQVAINVDGDTIAAMIAKALTAQKLIFLTNVRGLLKNLGDEKSLVREITVDDLKDHMRFAQGRMLYKLQSAHRVASSGVEVVIANGRIQDPVSRAICGQGTTIRKPQSITT